MLMNVATPNALYSDVLLFGNCFTCAFLVGILYKLVSATYTGARANVHFRFSEELKSNIDCIVKAIIISLWMNMY